MTSSRRGGAAGEPDLPPPADRRARGLCGQPQRRGARRRSLLRHCHRDPRPRRRGRRRHDARSSQGRRRRLRRSRRPTSVAAPRTRAGQHLRGGCRILPPARHQRHSRGLSEHVRRHRRSRPQVPAHDAPDHRQGSRQDRWLPMRALRARRLDLGRHRPCRTRRRRSGLKPASMTEHGAPLAIAGSPAGATKVLVAYASKFGSTTERSPVGQFGCSASGRLAHVSTMQRLRERSGWPPDRGRRRSGTMTPR